MNGIQQQRTLQRIVEDRVLRWSARHAVAGRRPRKPVVAISRQEGTHGDAAARALADDLDMDFYDREIVQPMIEKESIRDRVMRSLDERGRGFIEDLFTHLAHRYGITSDEYFRLLGRTIGTIDWHGNAVIVGRGATHFVRRPENLTVRFVAPQQDRIAILCSERGLQPGQARDRIVETDREREAFLHRYFPSAAGPEEFDLVIDNEFIGLAASIQILETAVRTKLSAMPSAGWARHAL